MESAMGTFQKKHPASIRMRGVDLCSDAAPVAIQDYVEDFVNFAEIVTLPAGMVKV